MRKAASNILIDTSAWVDFFRGSSKTAVDVGRIIEKGRAAVCGVIIYELVQGARSEKEALQLSEVLGALHYIEMSDVLWTKAGMLSSELRAKGNTLPMSDLLIAATALYHSLEVLTLDSHFEVIPGVKLYHRQ